MLESANVIMWLPVGNIKLVIIKAMQNYYQSLQHLWYQFRITSPRKETYQKDFKIPHSLDVDDRLENWP